jgi:hypothetical protein
MAKGIPAAMRKEIFIQEPAGLDRSSEYIEFSVPCCKGEALPADSFILVDQNGVSHPVQTKGLAFWPDGSIKWLHVISCLDVPAVTRVLCLLENLDSEKLPPLEPIRVKSDHNAWKVDTGSAVFEIPTSVLAPFSTVRSGKEEILVPGASGCTLLNKDSVVLVPHITSMELEEDGPLRATVHIAGEFRPSDNARFFARLQFFAGKRYCKIAFTLHNPCAARHPGGVWDLGEEASCLFKGLSFTFKQPVDKITETCFSVSPDSAFASHPAQSAWSIYQESSGGDNWRSPVHRNRAGVVPLAQRGFVVEEKGQVVHTGQRATPIVWTGGEKSGVAACLPLFWQEFPKEIAITDQGLTVSLFPVRFPDLHELQPGEQKTHTFFVDYSHSHEQLSRTRTPLEITLPALTYIETGIFTDLPGSEDLVDQFTSIEQLLAKRERIDEYGWRNFGDVYADHEAVFHQGEQPLISHYNNQYDLVAGAYRKFFITGNPLWRQFAADMAQHVLDIDIYHTTTDREEYNHGLFWHTEHYSDAGLSTHRSYSKEQKKTYDLYAGGGGPGAEHCYTTGLLIHYFQTGNQEFKQAVLSLAEWELLALSGAQTILAAIKRCIDNLKLLRAQTGRKRLFPRYPLTRGTGNAITACLDAYEVSQDQQWLAKVESIIQGTLHPQDDIQRRDVLNAEIGWSYTVLLTAAGKYLEKKRQLEQYDNSFHHARLSLLAYAAWMVTHEYPYLDKPEILEYPNETWAAQDIRKSVIFYLASRYAETEEQATGFYHKAQFFYNHAADELNLYASSSFTRPVALILQNGWIGERIREVRSSPPFSEIKQQVTSSPIPCFTLWAVIKRFVWDVSRALQCTSLRRERAWLQARCKYSGSKRN